MTERRDDRPLTSDEMIKQARADLDQRPGIEDVQAIDTDQIRQEIDEEMPSPSELVAPPRSSPRPRAQRRVARADRQTPAGFGTSPKRAGNAIALAVAMALLVIGGALFLVLAASGTG